MSYKPEINKYFSAEQIADFILENDNKNVFPSARLNRDQFVQAIKRLNNLNYVIVFRNGDSLQGVLGWYFVSDFNKHEATKATWRLPDNITDGDILYLSFIETKGDCDIVAIKTMFEDMGYRKKITRRRGYTNGAWYEKKIFRE